MAALAAEELPSNLRLFIADPSGRDAYPIVTFSWILLYKNYDDPRKARSLRDLLRWCLTEGQRDAANLGYVPLAESVSSRSLAAVGSIAPVD
jgi:phosphate transport system substrate-binding protein